MDLDLPPGSDATPSESGYSLSQSQSRNQSRASTSMDMSSQDAFSSVAAHPAGATTRPRPAENHLQALSALYTRHSTATDLQIRVAPPASQNIGTGRGTLIIPGWIRERAAEVLFEGGDVDEGSVAEIILDSLLKVCIYLRKATSTNLILLRPQVPVDLRKTMASSILVVGGTPMLPGFIPRLHAELVRAVSQPSVDSPSHRSNRRAPPAYDRYAPLRPLLPYFAVLNNPTPPPPSDGAGSATTHAGKAPAFAPATMAWVGGSLAGALKTGGMEVSREKWDEADPEQDPHLAPMADDGTVVVVGRSVIPDWTRTVLPLGAPSVRPVPAHAESQPSIAVEAVGA
jgi:actin-related protein 10